MTNTREYDIAFVGLRQDVHVFEYNITNQFFVQYGEQDFTNCNAYIKLSLDKNNGFMLLKFDVGGTLDLLCDRCGNTIHKQLWDEFNIIVKLVEEPETMNEQEEDPDIYYISRGESYLHVADWIYEFINLSIPLQKMCSKDEKGNSTCNPVVIEKLRKMEEEVLKETNPLWKGLDKFKDLEN